LLDEDIIDWYAAHMTGAAATPLGLEWEVATTVFDSESKRVRSGRYAHLKLDYREPSPYGDDMTLAGFLGLSGHKRLVLRVHLKDVEALRAKLDKVVEALKG